MAPRKQQTEGEQELLASEQITYVPKEGDPPSVKWNRHVFQAHVPKTVSDPNMITLARGNPGFVVGTFDPKTSGRVENETTPATPEQYRAHAIAWLMRAKSCDDIAKNWSADTALREACEVGTDDYLYLGSLIDPRWSDLAKSDQLNTAEQQAAVWVRYGVTDLPWRSR